MIWLLFGCQSVSCSDINSDSRATPVVLWCAVTVRANIESRMESSAGAQPMDAPLLITDLESTLERRPILNGSLERSGHTPTRTLLLNSLDNWISVDL